MKRLPPLRPHLPPIEFAARKACALAGLGRFADGLNAMEECVASDDIPLWMYYARLAEVYDVAQMHEKSLECHRLAHNDAPDNPTVKLELALALLKNEVDTATAQQLIASAEQQTLSDMLLTMLPFIKGLAALNAGEFQEAERCLRRAEKALRPMARSAALVRLVLDINSAYTAVALVNLGERQNAERLFEKAYPRLEALKASRILARCHKSFGRK